MGRRPLAGAGGFRRHEGGRERPPRFFRIFQQSRRRSNPFSGKGCQGIRSMSLGDGGVADCFHGPAPFLQRKKIAGKRARQKGRERERERESTEENPVEPFHLYLAYRAFEPRLAACINLSRSGPMGVPFPVFYLCLESSQDRFFPPASAFILPGRRHHPVSDERNFVPSNDVCGGRLPHRPFRANEGERHFFPPRPALEKIMKFFPPRGWIPQGRIMLTHSFSFLFFLMSDFLPYGKRQKNMPIIL